MYNLELWQYALIALSAFLVGLGKGGLPGVGNLTVVLAALVLPAKASVGILLPILISADIIAVLVYRRHTEWRYIWKLAPWVIIGIVILVAFAWYGASAGLAPMSYGSIIM